MHDLLRQRFSWRRLRFLLIATTTILPALLLSFGFLTPATALASHSVSHLSNASGVIVNPAVKHDVSRPLRSIRPVHTAAVGQDPTHNLPKIKQGAPNGLQSPVQSAVTKAAPSPSNNFDGVGSGFTGPQGTFAVNSAPPDTNGVVGTQDYIQIVNTDFAIFNKDASRGTVGSVRYGPVQINTLWSGFGGLCQTDNDGDPVVVYDSIANRWIISQFAVTNPDPNYYQCVAVSTGSDPTGTYNRYAFSYTNFPDYPKMGLWSDAYYITFNMFDASSNFVGAEVCAYNRTSMLSGASAIQQCFTTSSSYGGLLPSSLNGSTLPPSGSPNYILGLNTTTSLALWKFHVDWTTSANSTFTGPSNIAVASYAQACSGGTCIPQSGTTNQLDSLADRLMYHLDYRNFGTYESLVVDHAITSGSSVGMRWYEIRNPGGTPTVYQSGTYAPDTQYRWMGSIAQDASGDLAMGFSISSSSTHPGISYTGRLASDTLGSMAQGETSLIVGAGSQTGTLTRWGDYSNMSVDPSDGCTFWYTNQYIPSNGSFNWKTRIGTFKFSSCGSTTTTNDFSMSASPTSLSITQGQSSTSTISTAVTSGSAGTVSLSASVSPSGPTAALSSTSVTAGSSSTLTVSVGSSVATGTYTVTVSGTEGSATHSTSVTVTVISSSGGGITNGGFETGSFSGWTTTGTTSISSTAHSGTHSGQAGSTSPTNGDSTITQTFTVPTGLTTLTFWYQVNCPDTLTYDWATATLKDSASTTTSTILAKTCNNNATWVKVTASVTAGHTYTLILISHDDNYTGDPTYTRFDDVSLS